MQLDNTNYNEVSKKSKENYKMVICIFGCITIEKYRLQIQKIKETFEKKCNENIKILYFLGGKEYPPYHEDNLYI
jgi:hypothetical protein